MKKLLKMCATLVLIALMTGCATIEKTAGDTWHAMKQIDDETWMIAGAVIVTGIIISQDDNNSRPPDPSDCFRPCPGRCVKPKLCN